MKRFRQCISILMVLALVAAFVPMAALAAEPAIREKAPYVAPADGAVNIGTYEGCGLIPEEVYRRIILQQPEYPEGTPWDNERSYTWNVEGIVGYGCAAFAFMLSDAAFGDMPATRIDEDITIDTLRSGDVLRLDNDTHTAVVLRVYDDHITIAEGNYNNSVHWGRELTASEIEETVDYIYTRYEEHTFVDGECSECGAPYIPDPSEVRAYGEVGDDATWYLYYDGRMEIRGTGPIWDFPEDYVYPSFHEYEDLITEVYICEGITGVGVYVFWLSQMEFLSIAGSVDYLGEGCFGRCSNLETVEFQGDAPEFGQGVFYEDSLTVRYPAGDSSWDWYVGDDLGGYLTWESYDPGTPVSMELTTLPSRIYYVEDEVLDLSGIEARVTFDDGTTRTYGAGALTGSCDMSSLGVQTATVSYRGVSATYSVYVHENVITEELDSSRYPESSHPYSSSLYDEQEISEPGAAALILHFSDDSNLESHYDNIYIYDASGTEVATLTGSDMSGMTLRIPGDTVTIVLSTDGSVTRYGYSFDSIEAEYIEHEEERIGAVEATCEEPGHTGALACRYCPLVMEEGEEIAALGHDLVDGACTRPGCGFVDVIKGDVNGDDRVTSDDAIHLLYYTLFGESMYPINQPCDFNGDGAVNSDDAIHLLYYTLFGESMYPLS